MPLPIIKIGLEIFRVESVATGMNPQICLEEGKLRKRPGNESSGSEGKLMMQSLEEKQV